MTIFHAHILGLENTGDGRKHLELRQTTSNPGTVLSLLGGSFQRLNSLNSLSIGVCRSEKWPMEYFFFLKFKSSLP